MNDHQDYTNTVKLIDQVPVDEHYSESVQQQIETHKTLARKLANRVYRQTKTDQLTLCLEIIRSHLPPNSNPAASIPEVIRIWSFCEDYAQRKLQQFNMENFS